MRLHDRNVSSDDALDGLLDWVDILLVGGMLTQQREHLNLIEAARARGLPVVVGGPDVSSSPHLYERANFLVIGEAEGCMPAFIAAWEGGAREGRFETPMGNEELVQGRAEPSSRQAYREVIARLVERGAEAVILGCTEIMLLVQREDSAAPLFDTTALHAEAAVDLALAGV